MNSFKENFLEPDPDDNLIVPASSPSGDSPPAAQRDSHDFGLSYTTKNTYPDKTIREPITGLQRHRLKTEIDRRQREANRKSRGYHRNPQFSEKPRDNSAAGVIHQLLIFYKGDRVKTYEKIMGSKMEKFKSLREGKTPRQLKWQIAQVAWRFGFRKR